MNAKALNGYSPEIIGLQFNGSSGNEHDFISNFNGDCNGLTLIIVIHARRQLLARAGAECVSPQLASRRYSSQYIYGENMRVSQYTIKWYS